MSEANAGSARAGDRRQAAVLLAAALLVGLALRVGMIEGRRIFSHDGVIACLAAAGQQARWEEVTRPGSTAPPYGRWAPAVEWQQFLRVDRSAGFREIARGLAEHDVHPPLYFWLLHWTCRALGTDVWTGLLLNTLIDLATALIVFAATRWWLRDSRWAAIATLVWMISPAAIETMHETRQYALLALVGVAFGWRAIRVIDTHRQARAFDYVLLAALTTAGGLTHYYFALVAIGALLLAAIRRRGAAVGLICAMVAGLAGALALDPWLTSFFTQSSEVSAAITAPALVMRLLKVGYHLFDLWGSTDPGNVILGLALLVWLGAVMAWRPGGERLRGVLRGIFGEERNPFMALALLVFGLTGLAYITFVVPHHAIGPRYLAPVWPLMAIGVVGTLRRLRARRWLLPALLAFALANSAWLVLDFRGDQARRQALVDRLSGPQFLLVDQVGRGALLPLVHEVSADTMLYAAHPDDILSRASKWEPLLRDEPEPKAYLSNIFLETKRRHRRAIIEMLQSRGWQLQERDFEPLPWWRLYELER